MRLLTNKFFDDRLAGALIPIHDRQLEKETYYIV
jgi:hypothetical protein